MTIFRSFSDQAKSAFEKDKIYDLLIGKDEYFIYCMLASVPTDWTFAIPGLYSFYEETEDENVKKEIVNKYEKAINKLVDDGNNEQFENDIRAINLWTAVNVLFFQIDQEEKNKTPFKIDRKICDKLKENIKKNRDLLKNCHKFVGHNDEDGLTYDIFRLNNILKNDYKISPFI